MDKIQSQPVDRISLGQSLITGDPLSVEDPMDAPSDVYVTEEVPKLTQEVMQKWEKRKELYDEKHASGGFFGFFKKVFGAIGNFIKGIAKIAAPVVLDLIPGVGPVLATAYSWGMAAYEGVKAVTSLVHGKVVEALSLAADSISSVAKLTTGAFSKGAARVALWIRKGIDIYRKGEAIIREVRP